MTFLDGDLELIFSNAPAAGSSNVAASTATAASSGNYHEYDWNNWSPVMDHDVDFSDLIESIVGAEETAAFNNSTLPDSVELLETTDEEDAETDDSKGIRLIHLLTAAAEALTGSNRTEVLARVILDRLKELVNPNDQTNMERLAAHLTNGLSGLLDRNRAGAVVDRCQSPGIDNNRMDEMGALQLFQDMSPYTNFGYLTANQAILEAVESDRRVHVVDYEIMDGIQWASLIQAMVSRNSGQHLKITALLRTTAGRKSVASVQESGRRLTVFADSVGLPFSFHQCKLDSDDLFNPSSLKLVKGEGLVINCMLHLPWGGIRNTRNSIPAFLTEAKTLNPRLVTVVEEETGLTGDEGFLGRFMDILYRFSAMFDSLDAGFPNTNASRRIVEMFFFGPWISGSLSLTERCSLGQWLETNRFKPVGISYTNHCQAKLLLGLFNDGYRLEEMGINRLVLGWKSRRLVSVSLWTSPDSHL